MLVAAKVTQALGEHTEAFRQAAAESIRLRDLYLQALDWLPTLSSADVAERFQDEPWPGARSTDELERRGLVIPFEERWETAQEARAWALQRLRGVPTLAVDGSQIAASKEFGVPISLVQVAWFENYHDADRPYIKDIRNEIVTIDEQAREIDEYVLAESKLNQRRFVLEMQTAIERLKSLEGTRSPVVFVDTSLVLSFANRLAPWTREAYLQALFHLLDASETYRVPVVGYIDLSFASDLVTMLRTLFDLPRGTVFDARILGPILSSFDRTAAFECARGDVLPHYTTPERDYSHDLCFVYLKTGHDRLPARTDFPRWILEAGLLDEVLDVVRAEIVVGNGYPYALETADAAAVLTSEDRLTFYRLFHEFAQASGLKVSMPGKSVSKSRRR